MAIIAFVIELRQGEMHSTCEVSALKRVALCAGALALVVYAAFDVWTDDLVIPGKRSNLHLSGLPAWVLTLALCCAAASWLSVVVGHYDQLEDGTDYEAFRLRCR